MLPELFRIPIINLPIHTYGALYVLGLSAGLFIAYRQALLGKKYYEDIVDFGFWVLLGALIGARILFIIVERKYYFVEEPFTTLPIVNISIPTVLAFHKGGFVFWGGAIGGIIALVLFCKKRNLPLRQMADFCAIGLPLGHAIGRMGCIAGGCCYGHVTSYHVDNLGHIVKDHFYALQFPRVSIAFHGLYNNADTHVRQLMDKASVTLPLFPVQIVESLGNLLIFIILFSLTPFKRAHGQMALGYLILYSIARSINETLRGDEARGFFFGLSTSQLVSLIVSIIAFILIVILSKNAQKSYAK